MVDADCGSGQLCACHGSAYSHGEGNTCSPGNCRVDADCGAAGYCSPAYATSSCGSLAGYYCHTPADECIDDKDCAASNGLGVCTYSSTVGHWQCKPMTLCA
jgi:hypothetical protein